MEKISKNINSLEKTDTDKPIEKVETSSDQKTSNNAEQEIYKKQQTIINTMDNINKIRIELGLSESTETPPSIVQNKKDIENLEKQEFNFEIVEPKEEETPEEYISRLMHHIADQYRNNDLLIKNTPRLLQEVYYGRHVNQALNQFFSISENCQKIKEKILEIEVNDDEKFSKEKNEITFSKLNKDIIGSTRESASEDEYNKMDYYANTNQTREFFRKGRTRDAYSYSSMMFGLPDSFIDTIEGKEYLHHKIDDKTIFLFGGGDSIKDLLKSEEFKPRRVINFDPFVKEESIDKNPNNIYESQTISASDKKIREMVDNNEISRADEVWATYSVPFYLDKSEEIKELLINMTSVLNEGGNARISPIDVQSREKDGENLETRKMALIDSIKSLLDSSDYNVSVFNNTLKIHKIKNNN